MLKKEVLIPRLTIAKYLYQQGYLQSKQPESVAFTCLLSFHDAVEMFLKLAAENAEVKSEKLNFSDYWDKIPSLTLKESMRSLNTRRVNLKHKGILPAKQDLEISRVNVTDFFEQNTKTQFNIEFKEISLVNLVSYKSVREFLEIAQSGLESGDVTLSITNAAFAFNELIYNYENNKKDGYKGSLFKVGEKAFFTMRSQNNLRKLDGEFAENMTKINKTMEKLQNSIKIMGLGIDYRKYCMFEFLTPDVDRMTNNTLRSFNNEKRNLNNSNCQFCIDFVIDSCLKLQDFEFDIQQLLKEEDHDLKYVSGNLNEGLKLKQVPKKKTPL